MSSQSPEVPKAALLFCAIVSLGGIAFTVYMLMARHDGGMAVALPILCVTSFTSVIGQFVLIPKAIVAMYRAPRVSAVDVAILVLAQLICFPGLFWFYLAAGSLYHEWL